MLDKEITPALSLRESLAPFLQRFEINRAVFFGVIAKVWSLSAGVLTAFLIVTRFSPVVQGYYYTFGTILALQMLVELGLGTVIIQFASHEWSRLGLDDAGHITGDGDALSRLTSIAHIAMKWYAVGAIILTIGLGFGGYFFFSTSPEANVVWRGPWFTLCLLTGMTIILVPVWSLLEGCNQVRDLYRYRFIQGAITSISLWIGITLGSSLWAASISSATALVCAGVFLRRKYWNFFRTLLSNRPKGPRLEWRRHILPMQWRIAVTWVSGYFIYFIFTPILFKYHGPIIAGQFGMTWSLVGVVGAISGSWLAPRVPQFGMLIARKDYSELDRLFWKLTKIIVGITIAVASSLWLSICILNGTHHPLASGFASRLLPPLPVGLLLGAQILQISSMPFSAYMRAHKQEPILVLSISAAIMAGLSALILGKYYSATGMAFGYFIVNLLIIPFVFVIWHRFRHEWHGDGAL
jgi:O-antigen/teichoic acid export membrane protein